MPLTLSDVLQAAYRDLGQFSVFKATGGSTSTVIDTTLIGRGHDDEWKNSALFIVRDAGAAAAAPEGQFQRVSGYVNSTGVFTVDTVFSAAVAVGDVYGVALAKYPLQNVIQSVNDALRHLGDVDLVDTTTLDTLVDTTEYAASATWKRTKPFRVDVQGRTGNAADNQWFTWPSWEYIPAAAGTAGKIVLDNYQPSGRDIRVWYRGPHGAVYAYSDVINEAHDPATVIAAVTVKVLEHENRGNEGANPFKLQTGQKAEQLLNELQLLRPPQRVKRRSKLFMVRSYPDSAYDDDTIGPP